MILVMPRLKKGSVVPISGKRPVTIKIFETAAV